jgi:hypothetical protein
MDHWVDANLLESFRNATLVLSKLGNGFAPCKQATLTRQGTAAFKSLAVIK